MSHEPAQNRTETASDAQKVPEVIRELQAAREAKWDEAVLAARWPNGDYIEGITKRTAALVVQHLMALAAEETFEATSALRQELAQAQAENERLRAAGGLACSALDLYPDHADTCQHALNPEYECNCWRAVVYEASVDLTTAALAAEPTPAADHGADVPEEPCPDCGDDPSDPTLHAHGCPRIGSPVQFGPPWLPIPAPVADPDDTKDGQR